MEIPTPNGTIPELQGKCNEDFRTKKSNQDLWYQTAYKKPVSQIARRLSWRMELTSRSPVLSLQHPIPSFWFTLIPMGFRIPSTTPAQVNITVSSRLSFSHLFFGVIRDGAQSFSEDEGIPNPSSIQTGPCWKQFNPPSPFQTGPRHRPR